MNSSASKGPCCAAITLLLRASLCALAVPWFNVLRVNGNSSGMSLRDLELLPFLPMHPCGAIAAQRRLRWWV